jgi:HlyD family secretion protein
MTTTATDELRRAMDAEQGGRRWLRRGAIGLAVVAVVGAGLAWRVKHRPPPPARYVTAEVTAGEIAEKVQATGAVQPLLQVNVGSQVNGRVTDVLVDFNSVVKKGAVLAIIDPTLYGAQVSQTQAQLLAQRAQLESSKASLAVSKTTFERLQRLVAQNLASQQDLDTARGQYDVAVANAASQQAQIAAIQAQLTQSVSNVNFTKLYSPVDGVVVSRAIDPGATVVASFQSPTLFVIAQDLRQMRVMADVDEADVGKLREGMDAEAVVDAFPGETFNGRVSQVRFSPNTVQGVVTYSAVVEVANPEEKLRPGMTATVTIKTREVKGIPRLPNAALRYKPTPPTGPDGKPLPQPPEPALEKGKGRIFVVTSDKPGDEKSEARVVNIGITDGIHTELQGTLPAGTKIVTDETDDDKKKKGKMF